MSTRLRVYKVRHRGYWRPWVVRKGSRVLGAFPTGTDALDFVRRTLADTQR